MLRIAVSAVALAAAWFAYSTLVTVDTGDVVAYNGLDRHLGTSALRAGDLVALAPDGNPRGVLCALGVPEDRLQIASVRKTYVNRLDEALPGFSGVVNWFARLTGAAPGGEGATLTRVGDGLSFRGRLSEMTEAASEPGMGPSCACAVAQAILRREQVCVVERALVEEEIAQEGEVLQIRSRTVGATFRLSNVLISEPSAVPGCPQVANANADFVQPDGLCAEGSRLRYDVALRARLGVIREEAVN
jgi:hypothetical protein